MPIALKGPRQPLAQLEVVVHCEQPRASQGVPEEAAWQVWLGLLANQAMDPEQLELKRVHRLIQSFGLHRTTPRVAVLRALMESGSPMSHAEITELLKATGVGSATVYANLKAMSSVGLLRRLDLGDHIWRYELAPSGKDKPNGDRLHFLCRKCGRVSRLPGSTVNLQLTSRAPRSAREGRVELQLRGLCDHCENDELV